MEIQRKAPLKNFINYEPPEFQKQGNNFECSTSYNSQDGSLILRTNIANTFDARKDFYINKDGSGTLVTDWGSRTFEPETFNSILRMAKEITNKEGFIFSEENTKLLHSKIQEIIRNLKDSNG